MPFKKGKSGNPEGRGKGTPNRTSEEVRQTLLKLLSDNLERLQRDLDSMEPKDRASLLISLAKHIVPQALNPEKLSEEQLNQVLDYLKQQQNENHS